MTGEVIPFNPLDKKNLGASVAEALVSSTAHPLGDIPSFNGAGIYAIYYHGNFGAYELLSKENQDPKNPTVPIYVGKAVPAGGRKGLIKVAPDKSRALCARLSEHAESIRASENLNIEHFKCRYLVVDDIWIPLGEALIISKFGPIWNGLLDGFGNHDPGSGRYGGLMPRWDLVHPGRAWARKCKPRPETADDVLRDARSYLSNTVFPSTPHFTGANK